MDTASLFITTSCITGAICCIGLFNSLAPEQSDQNVAGYRFKLFSSNKLSISLLNFYRPIFQATQVELSQYW